MPSRLLRRLVSTGPLATFRRARFKIATRINEWRFGLKTESFIAWDELSDDPCTVDYEPTTYSALSHVFNREELNPANDVLLDYGCGMGRVLAMASKRGFKKAIGVEFSEGLCGIATENLKRAGVSENSKVICAHAVDFPVPEDVSVVYMFNPFRGDVLTSTLRQLRKSMVEAPRQLTILYLQPVCDPNQLEQQEWLRETHRELIEGIRFCVYQNVQ